MKALCSRIVLRRNESLNALWSERIYQYIAVVIYSMTRAGIFSGISTDILIIDKITWCFWRVKEPFKACTVSSYHPALPDVSWFYAVFTKWISALRYSHEFGSLIISIYPCVNPRSLSDVDDRKISALNGFCDITKFESKPNRFMWQN